MLKSNFQNESVTYWKIKEASIGLHEDIPLIFKSLNNYIPFLKNSIEKLIKENKNKKIYLFGACATTTVLIETLGLANKISGIIDDNLKRQNRFSPGRGISVFPKSILNSEDIVINTAWRHNTKIKESLKKKTLKNYILPIPYPKFETH